MTTATRTLVLTFVLAAGVVLAACGSDQSGATVPAEQADTAAAQEAAVRMADTTFSPASVSVAAGSTVTWTNDDSLPHTVSFGDSGPRSSSTIDPGATFQTTFDEAGTYPYVCTLHPGMDGTVEVTA